MVENAYVNVQDREILKASVKRSYKDILEFKELLVDELNENHEDDIYRFDLDES
jgi:hypothetical protein